ncbi:MAG: guanine permease [Firmicutes bacterium ZCTH02-B6]|nr:MAG: guanine permease [Firmicutes bacterium ZCTH02-B6]
MSSRAAAVGSDGSLLDRWFRLKENGTTVRTEVAAGLTTFMTMAYIIFVNPGILSSTGMDFDGVLIATVMATAFGTLLMAFLANYPFALAPGMGLNAYFAFTVVLGRGVSWETALGAVFLSGVIFVLLTLTRVRETIVNAVPDGLKVAISAAIGLFIAFIGAQNAGLIVDDPATLVALGDLRQPGPLLALLGTLLTAGLLALHVRGAILWGILATTVAGALLGYVPWPERIIEVPSLAAWATVAGKLDIPGALRLGFFEIVLVFLFVDFFDTMGTLVGVSTRAGFLDENGRLPRARSAMLSDALSTVFGSLVGTSTVTTYVESASGVSAGGRTGLTAVTVAVAFVLSLFFAPIVRMVADFPPATAPALIVVGALMMQVIGRIKWEDVSEAFPAFITVIAMPLTYSIATGIALGFISYPVVKLISGKGREVHWLVYVLAILFALRFAFLG